MEARVLMMKLMYIFGEMDKIDSYFNEKELSKAMETFTEESNSRMLRLIAEAFAIKGPSLRHMCILARFVLCG